MGRAILAVTAGLVVLGGCGRETTPEADPFLGEARGPYLGEALPGDTAAIFGAGLISFGAHEHHLSMTPEGDEFFYVMADRYRRHHTVVRVVRRGERWLRPQVAPFSGHFNDFAPTFTPDGNRLLFCSNRPLPGAAPDRSDVNIWVAERTADGWGPPQPLDGLVNDETNEYNPTVTSDGTLYFQDHDETGADLYQATLQEGGYGPPSKVPGVNTPYLEMAPWVTPDGRALFFASTRPGGLGELDLWVSIRDDTDRWSEPRNLGPRVNTEASEAVLTLSPDGQVIFFTAFWPLEAERQQDLPYEDVLSLLRGPENADGTLFWIHSAVLEEVGLSVGGPWGPAPATR